MTESFAIPRIDAAALFDPAAPGHGQAARALAAALTSTGFMTLTNTAIPAARIAGLIETYRRFFHLPEAQKAAIDMARTGSNRGWGAPGAERVDPEANPDYKQVFDCGTEIEAGRFPALENLPVYGPNLWPADMPGFRAELTAYWREATALARQLLRAIAAAMGEEAGYFDDKFEPPMTLLRGNFYPPRPAGAGARDFGIGAHTDYGCLTLLATDGTPGLEVRAADGSWVPVTAPPGDFVINFGEMLEIWTGRRVRATLHRVVGTAAERISVPLFFNPAWTTNVAPRGSGKSILAGEHLQRRFRETYLHLQPAS